MVKKAGRHIFSRAKAIFLDLGFDAFNNFHYLRHNLRGNRVRKQYFTADAEHPPVILLQGFLGTRGVLLPLEKHLRESGRDVISIDLGMFNVTDIRKSAQLLSYKMERIMDRFGNSHGITKVDVIGHSMGGLIGLYYIKRLGGHRLVRKLITLGAPFNGTWTSVLGVFPFGLLSKGIWQMLPNSEFLKSLKSHPHETQSTEVVSIAASFDALCPPASCHLHGAKNIDVAVGHAGLLMDKKVFQSIDECLAEKSRGNKVVNLTRP